MKWTDERTEILKKAVADGLSARQTARLLGGFEHCADEGRSAVIGKTHRMGLACKNPQRSLTPSRKKRKKIAWRFEKCAWRLEKGVLGDRQGLDFRAGCSRNSTTEPLPLPRADDVARLTFLELDEFRHCKFIVGDPKGPFEKQFCGHKRIDGLPYCEGHARRCFDRLPSRYLPKPQPGRILVKAAGLVCV